MRKLIFFLAFLLMIPVLAHAQQTAPVMYEFEVAQIKNGDSRNILFSDPYVVYNNHRSKLFHWVLGDSSALSDLSPDQERTWSFEVDSIVTVGVQGQSRVYLTYKQYDELGRKIAADDTVSVETQATLSFYNDVDIEGSIDLIMFPTDSIATNSISYVRLMRRAWQTREVETIHPASRLTLMTVRDTLLYATGAFSTGAFPLNRANITAWMAMGTANTATGAQAGVGLMVSWDTTAAWFGPADDAIRTKDSLQIVDSDFTAIRDAVSFLSLTHPYAPWGKLVFFGVNTTGRVWVDSVGVFYGD